MVPLAFFPRILGLFLLCSQAFGHIQPQSGGLTSLQRRAVDVENFLACTTPCLQGSSSSSRRRDAKVNPFECGIRQNNGDVSSDSSNHTSRELQKRVWAMSNTFPDNPEGLGGGGGDLAFQDPPYSIGQVSDYLFRQFNKIQTSGSYYDTQYGNLALIADPGTYPSVQGSYKSYSQYRAFGNQAFQLGHPSVFGCTVITVVSPRAVWMSHLWEPYINGLPGKDWFDDDVPGPNTPEAASVQAFKERALNFLTNTPVNQATSSAGLYTSTNIPINMPYEAPVAGQALDRTTIQTAQYPNGDDIYVYHATPGHIEGGQVVLDYPQRAAAIESTLRNYLGSQIKLSRVQYTRLRNSAGESATFTDPRGQYLFQYDPNANPSADANTLYSGRRQWRLFYEYGQFLGIVP